MAANFTHCVLRVGKREGLAMQTIFLGCRDCRLTIFPEALSRAVPAQCVTASPLNHTLYEGEACMSPCKKGRDVSHWMWIGTQSQLFQNMET